MAGAPPDQGQNQSGSQDSLWAAGGIVVFIFVIWYFFHDAIVRIVLKFKIIQLGFFSIFDHHYGDLSHTIEQFLASGKSLKIGPFYQVLDKASEPMSWLIIVVCLALGYYIYSNSSKSRFGKTFDMERMMVAEAKFWPQISIALKQNIAELDVTEGPWAMGQTPLQFARHNQLINITIIDEKIKATGGRRNRMSLTAPLLKEKAKIIFARQLGKPFRGIENEPDYIQSLFAVFSARYLERTPEARDIMKKINLSVLADKPDYTPGMGLAKELAAHPRMVEIMQQHAYTLTLMATMIEKAREDGVQASADFLWLKIVDRPLWYTLNNVGRRVAFSEVAGIISHWYWEKELQSPIIKPQVDHAVTALGDALDEIIFSPDDELAYRQGLQHG